MAHIINLLVNEVRNFIFFFGDGAKERERTVNHTNLRWLLLVAFIPPDSHHSHLYPTAKWNFLKKGIYELFLPQNNFNVAQHLQVQISTCKDWIHHPLAGSLKKLSILIAPKLQLNLSQPLPVNKSDFGPWQTPCLSSSVYLSSYLYIGLTFHDVSPNPFHP